MMGVQEIKIINNVISEFHIRNGGPIIGVNPDYQVGRLGCPNPSANLVGVIQALSFSL
ncbi:MAG: hypothetical protein GX308_03750 [Epulopiscium sp.]|nr:hypothetical protein [Candidatus Epulonipiscium sp.]